MVVLAAPISGCASVGSSTVQPDHVPSTARLRTSTRSGAAPVQRTPTIENLAAGRTVLASPERAAVASGVTVVFARTGFCAGVGGAGVGGGAAVAGTVSRAAATAATVDDEQTPT